jgi:septum site-determining protein MinC
MRDAVYRPLTIRADPRHGRMPMGRLSAQKRRHSSSPWRPGDDAARLKQLTKSELIRLVATGATRVEVEQMKSEPAIADEKLSSHRPTMLVNESVRSGQTIDFREGDIVILGSIGSGAEVVAGGSIHVYGALRGRAHAGASGASGVRIVCQRLEAELLAIGGVSRLSDDLDHDLRGRPAHAWLDSDSMSVAGFINTEAGPRGHGITGGCRSEAAVAGGQGSRSVGAMSSEDLSGGSAVVARSLGEEPCSQAAASPNERPDTPQVRIRPLSWARLQACAKYLGLG